MRRAAEGGEVRAMANLALLELEAGHGDEALAWSRRATTGAPMLAHARRTHGKVALTLGHVDEALAAFNAALAIEPNATNRFNVAVALLKRGRAAEAIPLLEECVRDPQLSEPARSLLVQARRLIEGP